MQDYIETAKKLGMEYYPFQFPIEVNNDKLVMGSGNVKKEVLLSKPGMTLLLQHLYEYVDRNQAKSFYRSKQFNDFAKYVNQCRATQVSAQLWRTGQVYTLAIRNSVVYGVCLNYSPKSNAEVLEDIQKAGLDDHIFVCDIQDIEMNVYLAYKVKDGFEIGLNIRNGETGHAALSYRLYVKQGEYTFSTPEFERRKHLSNMDKVDEQMKEAYTEISEIRFHEFVMNTEAKKFADMLVDNEAFDKLHEHLVPYQSRLKKLYQLLGFLTSQRNEKGRKGVSTKALDKIYQAIVEEL